MQALFDPSVAPEVDQTRGRYNSLYYFWSGDWQSANMMADQRISDKNVYKNTRQLWRNASAIVDLYAHTVYMGDLSSDGKSLPDGTRGAIPIDPQMPNQTDKDNLTAAISAWWTAVNYRQFMSLRPKFGSMLGDVLTELVDDRASGMPRPQMLWPGYVTFLDLDLSGNVKRISYEYDVEQPETDYFGERQPADKYLFRKDIDGQYYYYYRDNKLTQRDPNPYGFVPCIWDRHEIVFGDRGLGAIDRIFQQAVEMNSVLSHAMDYIQKMYGTPVGVKGTTLGNRNSPFTLNKRATTGDPMADAAMVAASLGILPMTDNGDFVTAKFESGGIEPFLQMMIDSMRAEAPESSFSQQILEMTQVTAPGVERALGPIIGRVKDARKNYDTQTIKLIQMALAMAGWRVQTNGYPAALVNSRPDRYQALAKFNLDSYGRGLLDFTIPDRPVIPETLDEKIARAMLVEQLQWEYHLQVAGLPPDVIAEVVTEREEEAERQARLEEVAVVGEPPVEGEE